MVRDHPYMRLPASAFWRSGVAACSPSEMDGIFHPKVAIGPSEAIATAGSCFAQHIGHHLQQVGLRADRRGACAATPSCAQARRLRLLDVFGAIRQYLYRASTSAARYGSVRRLDAARHTLGARGSFLRRPAADGRAERLLDSPDEVARHRAQHLEKVREVFRRMDVFVFTLGLTEAWRSRQHGTVYTIAPGVRSGTFDPERYEFVNFGFAEIESAFVEFVEALRAIRGGRPRSEDHPHRLACATDGDGERQACVTGIDLFEVRAESRMRPAVRAASRHRLLPVLRDHHQSRVARPVFPGRSAAGHAGGRRGRSWASSRDPTGWAHAQARRRSRSKRRLQSGSMTQRQRAARTSSWRRSPRDVGPLPRQLAPFGAEAGLRPGCGHEWCLCALLLRTRRRPLLYLRRARQDRRRTRSPRDRLGACRSVLGLFPGARLALRRLEPPPRAPRGAIRGLRGERRTSTSPT